MTNELAAYLMTLGLTAAQAEKLSAVFSKKKKLDKGDYYHKEQQTCKSLAFISEGMCRHFYRTDKGEVTRWVALKNEFVTSLGSLITQLPSRENIQAIKPTVLLIASLPDWQAIYKEEEFVRLLWLRTIEANYVGFENRVFNLIALTAEERYEWMLKHQPRFNEFVPDKYIASMLGIIPRHLSRIRANRK